MSKLNIQYLAGSQVYIKGTTVRGTVASFTYTHSKNRECVVEIFFEPYTEPDKTCFERALEIKGVKCHMYPNTNNSGEMMYRINDNIMYQGKFLLQDLSEVPYGGPVAELIYGEDNET